ncbi:uncharacterized protein [Watersipora subatra]|uniref:uncharacterized protein n=1 Tax=Watersipora subatra TaxID=2589382 RepID=UPI00355AE01B
MMANLVTVSILASIFGMALGQTMPPITPMMVAAAENTTVAKTTTTGVMANPVTVPAPVLIPNNCSVTLEAGQNCVRFGQLSCPPRTRFEVTSCRCEHERNVDPLTCELRPDPEFIPNLCNVKLQFGIGCARFGDQACGNGTAYDIKFCVCNHESLVNKITCSS